MAKTQGLKPDTVLKNYWRDNAQFADLFNSVLFEGRPVIRPEELEDVDTEESTVLEHREYAESIRASRDNIKIRKRAREHGVQLVMLGLESQEHIHYAMPMRVMEYDSSTYKKQYVNDYHMLLVEARQNDLELHHANNIDLFQLLKIILDRSVPWKETKEKAIQYSEEHRTDRSVIIAAAGATNGKIDYHAFKKEDGRVCTLFEEIANEGRMEGRAAEIVETGIEIHLSEQETLDRLQKKLNIPLTKAQEYYHMYKKDTI